MCNPNIQRPFDTFCEHLVRIFVISRHNIIFSVDNGDQSAEVPQYGLRPLINSKCSFYDGEPMQQIIVT